MKKILMGLVALSTMAFAAQPVINGAAAEGTNVWEGATTYGAIEVTGTFTSTVKLVRYVIFASEDGSWGPTAEDRLTLPTFTLSKTPEESGFESVPKKVFVKKVTDSKDNVEAVVRNVTFILELDPAYPGLSNTQITNGGANVGVAITALLTKAQSDDLINKLNSANLGMGSFIQDNWGAIYIGSQYFVTDKIPNFLSTENGVLTISTAAPSLNGFTQDNFWDVINEFFATPVSNTFKIRAKVQ